MRLSASRPREELANSPLLLTSVFRRPSGFLTRLQQKGTLDTCEKTIGKREHQASCSLPGSGHKHTRTEES